MSTSHLSFSSVLADDPRCHYQVLETIVSRQQQAALNKQATLGDGQVYAAELCVPTFKNAERDALLVHACCRLGRLGVGRPVV
jgi:hypothetical protein